MPGYEVVREILNSCPGNQMRDVSIQDVVTDDPEAWVLAHAQGDNISLEREELSDGSTVFHLTSSGLIQKFTFTPD